MVFYQMKLKMMAYYSQQNITLYKTKNCKFFHGENSFCSFGEKCDFVHEERKLKDIQKFKYAKNLFIFEKLDENAKRLSCFQEITEPKPKKEEEDNDMDELDKAISETTSQLSTEDEKEK